MFLSVLSRQLMSFLHIAEKNSIAKEVAQILSEGSKRTGPTQSKYNPVYLFQMEGQKHTFSSVRGHLFDYELPPECKSWYAFDNRKILTREVPIIRKAGDGMDDLLRNLQTLARGKKELVLWLDCDRQGEAIAFEVLGVIKRINPAINIRRARFAAVTRQDIVQAYQNLTTPNELQANAVNYRIEIDFRMGCAFTRYQTTTFGKKFSLKERSVLSYGPCQMPTLGFVVDRYLQIKNFKPEKFWVVEAEILLDEKTTVELKCERGNIKDEIQANLIFANMYQKASEGEGVVKGKVLQRNKNEKKKYRPYPLTTVKFQKLATDKLRISSAQAMKIAEKLYMSGFISYPRTETNAFPATMHIPQLVKRLEHCQPYAGYVNALLEEGKFLKPKVGNQNDQAHAPIHPVKPADKAHLSPDEWRVYDLISRHFLACCSKDAVGLESEIVAEIGGEFFRASHLAIKQKNYLEIYPFEKWVESEFPGEIPEVFEAGVDLREGKTQAPGYLSESDLITQMQKNQIGTDSTIHEHIQTIQDRRYAVKTSNTFKPTNLGASLIVTYKQLGLRLEDCHIRRMIEARMNLIAEGTLSKENATQQTLAEVTPIFESLRGMEERWLSEMAVALQEHQALKQIEMEQNNGERNFQRNFERGNNNNDPQSEAESNATSIICFKCRKPGHLAPNCPDRDREQTQLQWPQPNRPEGNRERQRERQREPRALFCYNCKEPGHVVTDCPIKGKKVYEPEKVQGRKFACFTCGEEGHFAPDCPKKRKANQNQENGENTNIIAPVCYLCKQEGHFANRCPNKGNPNNTKVEVKQERRKRACPVCGNEGRHPRDSTCTGLRKNKKNQSAESHDYNEE